MCLHRLSSCFVSILRRGRQTPPKEQKGRWGLCVWVQTSSSSSFCSPGLAWGCNHWQALCTAFYLLPSTQILGIYFLPPPSIFLLLNSAQYLTIWRCPDWGCLCRWQGSCSGALTAPYESCLLCCAAQILQIAKAMASSFSSCKSFTLSLKNCQGQTLS